MTVGGRGVGALVSVLVAALLAALPAGSAHAAEDLVEWPDIKDINPKVTPYEITVNDPDAVANLVARWSVAPAEWREVVLPHSGTVTLPFAETFDHNRNLVVTVYRCVNPTFSSDSCVALASGPAIFVWVEAQTTLGLNYSTLGTSPQAFSFNFSPPGLGTTTWRLLAADGSELLTGQTALGPGGQLTIATPPGTPEQVGSLDIVTSVDGTVVGHLDGRQTYPLILDGVAPPTPTISASASLVYPHQDGYLDSVKITYQTPGARKADIEAVNQNTGAVFALNRIQYQTQTQVFSFSGRSDSGQRLPAGLYRLRVVATDPGGQSSAMSEPIEVRWDALRMIAWRRTVRAATTVIEKYVGPCGTLRQPAEPGWRGSLGYYSGTCRDTDKALVQVVHGLDLPASFNDKYAAYRVSLIGGPNKRRPGSYLVLGYYTDAKKWRFENRTVFRGRGIQTHKGISASRQTMKFIHDDGKGPYVAWSTGLTQGSRYDVKSFTVTIKYQALVPEGQ